MVSSLFSLVSTVRYASKDSMMPYLPIGTAQLIDTVEIFMTRVRQDRVLPSDAGELMDWAASVKIAPLFEADAVELGQIENLAKSLKTPFERKFRRELLSVASAGMYFVSED